jgi:tetratricopeptide (TPR) repeat protein
MKTTKIFIFLIFVLIQFNSCEKLKNTLQNWSFEHRRERKIKITEEDLKTWQYQLKTSEEETKELFELIEKYAQKKKIQGEISWKIGKALLQQGSYELATNFFKQSINQELKEEEQLNLYESALPYFKKALLNYKPLPDLLYDAGICYGNAARVLGWEKERLKTALFLLERGDETYPDDIRFAYTLGILYGKIPEPYKDIERSITYLEKVIKKDRYHINAYFAKANILAENGNLQEAFYIYEEITKVIEEMYNKKLLRGDITRNQQYQQALQNMKDLQICIEGKPECKIQQK